MKENADTIVITGAVQSNFVRMAAAAAGKLGMQCHIQQESRVVADDPLYHSSGNVLVSKLLGAKLHSYPRGEDEHGADQRLEALADTMRESGRRPFVIPLGPDHPPLGALGYVHAAKELSDQSRELRNSIDEIVVGSGSGATHAGLLFGLKALRSNIRVTGVCVRRGAEQQGVRIRNTCSMIAALLEVDNVVGDEDIQLCDDFLAPGYGVTNPATLEAIVTGAQTEGLLLDPVYTGKAFAGFLKIARRPAGSGIVFLHTGGSPALFAYQRDIEDALTVALSESI